jgi:hypothetical protein
VSKSDQIQKLFVELMGEDVTEALSVSTGIFVALNVEYIKRQGADIEMPINIKSGDGQRDITIHPPQK